MYEKIAEWTDSTGEPERVLSRDQILDDITLYWLTNTAASSSRFYWENNNNNFSAAAQKTATIRVPVAVTVFPGEIYRAPESWTRRAYPSLYYFHEVSKGGHFAAWEQPSTLQRRAAGGIPPLAQAGRSLMIARRRERKRRGGVLGHPACRVTPSNRRRPR